MQRKFPFYLGGIYHIFNRGVAKNTIALEDTDSWRFLQGLCLFNDLKSTNHVLSHLERNQGALNLRVLKNYVVDSGNEREKLTRILAYCLMGNHYHLLVEEIREGGITKFMQKFGVGYVNYFNKKHDRVGGLFQGRFKNILVDDERYLQYLLVYINVLNPANFIEPDWKKNGIKNIKALLECAERYPWSTHQDYLGKRNSIIIEKGILGKIFPDPETYRKFVEAVLEEKKYEEIGHLFLE